MGGNVQVVVLNACFSQSQAEVISEYIPCAIGMKASIGDQAAIVFAGSFYRAVGFGRSVQDAFNQGIAALLLEGIEEDDTPRLIAREGVDVSNIVLCKASQEPIRVDDTKPFTVSGIENADLLKTKRHYEVEGAQFALVLYQDRDSAEQQGFRPAHFPGTSREVWVVPPLCSAPEHIAMFKPTSEHG